jgi:septum site-determining protein MinC
MSTALPGRSPATFEIKNANLSLLTLRLKSTDLDALAAELQAYYGDTPGFFEDDLLIVDLAYLPENAAALDFGRLNALLINCRLRPVAVAGGSSEWMDAAVAAGLSRVPDWNTAQPAQPQPQSRSQAPPSSASAPDPSAEPPPAPGALVIDKPLRSGQQVYARGRDLVLLAVSNSGSEVIADGHIHVYAPLRGRAIAGARGWDQARVFALNMQPELISIAGVYLTSEQGVKLDVWGHAATAHLMTTEAGDKLVFNPLN